MEVGGTCHVCSKKVKEHPVRNPYQDLLSHLMMHQLSLNNGTSLIQVTLQGLKATSICCEAFLRPRL